jgi:hypothetical protein
VAALGRHLAVLEFKFTQQPCRSLDAVVDLQGYDRITLNGEVDAEDPDVAEFGE